MTQYITPEQVQAELRADDAFSITTVPTLAQVEQWIDEESSDLDQRAGMTFKEVQYETYLDYNGADSLYLKHAPIISIDELEYATARLGTEDYATSWEAKTEDTHFVVYADKGKIVPVFTNWSPREGAKRIKVTYTAGYATIPAVVQKIVTKKVALRVLNSLVNLNVNTGNDGGSISVGSIQIVEPNGISINTLREMKEEIRSYESHLLDRSFGVYRYEGY